MRLAPVLLALMAAAAAWSAAQAQPMFDETRDRFQAELARQCPDKQLQLLSERALRDGLDNYMAGLGDDARAKLRQAEAAHCSSMSEGIGCVNSADIYAADQLGRLSELTASICGSFVRCHDQGQCDYAE